MSATSTKDHKDETSGPTVPNVDELIKSNPNVDAEQVREAQKLLQELRRDGVEGPSYEIVSPYERRVFEDSPPVRES